MKEVRSVFEAIEALQEGIDFIEVSSLYRPETDSHEKNYNAGIERLKASRDFLLELKSHAGNFTVPKYVR